MLITFLTPTLLSCSDDDEINEDIRDQYVGTWNVETTGELTFIFLGENIGSLPLDNNSTVEITKSGENDLMLGDDKYSVVGTNISSEIISSNLTTNEGLDLFLDTEYNGILGSNRITINGLVTGTWNDSEGFSGNLSGSATSILTK